MKKLLPLLLLVVMIKPAFSQLYGNEWINFSQTYFKFQVITNGLYRLNYSTLKNFGVPIDNINGANIQIFNDGKEIPIYVSSTGILGPNDYIEFYGTHNGGYWDSCLYTYPSDQGNSRLSLFNDTAYYFLTWSEQLSNNHITSTVNNIANPPSPELFCWYTSSYVSGTAKNSTNNLSKGDFAYQGLGMY
ncbi:MAG: hypothetical protein LH473_02015, partial [Chitinophagales bacterium]|nr:hypothetical protein [Chitinophagales bacterium]